MCSLVIVDTVRVFVSGLRLDASSGCLRFHVLYFDAINLLATSLVFSSFFLFVDLVISESHGQKKHKLNNHAQ